MTQTEALETMVVCDEFELGGLQARMLAMTGEAAQHGRVEVIADMLLRHQIGQGTRPGYSGRWQRLVVDVFTLTQYGQFTHEMPGTASTRSSFESRIHTYEPPANMSPDTKERIVVGHDGRPVHVVSKGSETSGYNQTEINRTDISKATEVLRRVTAMALPESDGWQVEDEMSKAGDNPIILGRTYGSPGTMLIPAAVLPVFANVLAVGSGALEVAGDNAAVELQANMNVGRDVYGSDPSSIVLWSRNHEDVEAEFSLVAKPFGGGGRSKRIAFTEAKLVTTFLRKHRIVTDQVYQHGDELQVRRQVSTKSGTMNETLEGQNSSVDIISDLVGTIQTIAEGHEPEGY